MGIGPCFVTSVAPLWIVFVRARLEYFSIYSILAILSNVSFVSLITFFAIGAYNFCTGINRSRPPITIFASRQHVAIFTIGAVSAILSISSIFSIGAFRV